MFTSNLGNNVEGKRCIRDIVRTGINPSENSLFLTVSNLLFFTLSFQLISSLLLLPMRLFVLQPFFYSKTKTIFSQDLFENICAAVLIAGFFFLSESNLEFGAPSLFLNLLIVFLENLPSDLSTVFLLFVILLLITTILYRARFS